MNTTDSDTVCRTEEEIEQAIKDGDINFFIMSAYFDHFSYSEPIKTFLNAPFNYEMMPTLAQHTIIDIHKNSVTRQDNIFLSNFDQSETFYSVGKERNSVSTSAIENDGVLLDIRLSLSNEENHFERSVYTIFQMLSDWGGLNEILKTFGGFLVSYFSTILFYNSIFSSIYHIKDFDESSKEKEFKQVIPTSSTSRVGLSLKNIEDNKSDIINTK